MRKAREIFILIAAPARCRLLPRRWFSEPKAGPPNYAYSATAGAGLIALSDPHRQLAEFDLSNLVKLRS